LKNPQTIFTKPMYVERMLFTSAVYRGLGNYSKTILGIFYTKSKVGKLPVKGKKQYIRQNNGHIVFTYAEALKKYSIPRSSFMRARDELVSKGFIYIGHHGGGMEGDCTLYGITEMWMHYGTDRFKIEPRKKDTRGIGFTKKNWESRTGKKLKPSITSDNA